MKFYLFSSALCCCFGAAAIAQTLSYVSGDGQMLYYSVSQPLIVRYASANGQPIGNATIQWTVSPAFGHLNTPTQFTSKTDANGLALLVLADPNPLQPVEQSQVLATPPVGNSVSFWITSASGSVTEDTLLDDGTIGSLNPSLVPNRTINTTAGALLPGAFKVAIGSSTGPGIPHIAISVTNVQPPQQSGDGGSIIIVVDPKLPSAQCVGNFLSDAKGVATCNLQVGSGVGMTKLYFVVANGNVRPAVTLNVAIGPPSKISVISGDGQSAPVGASLPTPLAVRVTDAGGNPVPKASVSWSVTQGVGTLSAPTSLTDSNGAASVNLKFGSTTGGVRVRALVNNTLSYTFNESAGAPAVSTLTVVSGDTQTATVGLPFPQALTVAAADSAGTPVPNAIVNFTVAGDAVLGAPSATTGPDGTASVNLTAGSGAGAVTVTAASASAPDVKATFQSLTVSLPGPQVSVASYMSAASQQPGLTPCGLSAISGTGIAPGVTGTTRSTPPALAFGPVQSLVIGGYPAPVTSVINDGVIERIEFQTPCEIPVGTTTAILSIQGNSAAVSVDGIPVSGVQPAIFTSLASDGLPYATAFRMDGSQIAPANQPTPGETIRVFVTGIGQTTPPIATGQISDTGGQTVNAALIGGLNNAGASIQRAEYLAGQIGLYFVDLTIPSDAVAGPSQPLVIAIPSDTGDLIYSNTVSIPIGTGGSVQPAANEKARH